MIFCKSNHFLNETKDTLNNHVEFINLTFGVNLKKAEQNMFKSGMPWFVSEEYPNILYMVGHTGDAIQVLEYLHFMYTYGFGTQIRDVYLNTCSAKPVDTEINPLLEQSSELSELAKLLLKPPTDEEKCKLKISENGKFVKLDSILEKVKSDSFKVHLCKQDNIGDENVKMARFLPMEECNLGFSPTNSELLLFNAQGILSEKLKVAFDDIT